MEGIQVSYSVTEGHEPQAVEILDNELQSLEAILEQLEVRIGPILSQYASAEAKLSEPRPEPKSQIRARGERLAGLNLRLRDIIERVDL